MKAAKRVFAFALVLVLIFSNLGLTAFAANSQPEPVPDTETPAPAAEESPVPGAEEAPTETEEAPASEEAPAEAEISLAVISGSQYSVTYHANDETNKQKTDEVYDRFISSLPSFDAVFGYSREGYSFKAGASISTERFPLPRATG